MVADRSSLVKLGSALRLARPCLPWYNRSVDRGWILTHLRGPFAKSLLRAEPLRRTIRSLVPASRFDELKIPLTVTAVDEERGDLVLFGEGGRSDVPLAEDT